MENDTSQDLTVIKENLNKCLETINARQSLINSVCAQIDEYIKQENHSLFQNDYIEQTRQKNHDINNIISEINKISYTCSQFSRLFELYDKQIQSFTGRLEIALERNPGKYFTESGEEIILSEVIGNILYGKGIKSAYLVKNLVKKDSEIAQFKKEIKNLEKQQKEYNHNHSLLTNELLLEKDGEIARLNQITARLNQKIAELNQKIDTLNIKNENITKEYSNMEQRYKPTYQRMPAYQPEKQKAERSYKWILWIPIVILIVIMVRACGACL